MYYDNKQTFYIRQYGPAVIVSVVSLILISSGVFIYMKSSNIGNPFIKNTEIAQTIDTDSANNNSATVKSEETVKEEDNLVEQNALVEEKKVEETPAPTVVVKYFENLPVWEKSKDVNVTNVSDTGAVTLELDGDKVEVTLIGVDLKYTKTTAFEKMKTDLFNKKVKVAFDTVRSENGVTYAYIFRDNKTSYNAELLKAGLATLKTERKNTKLIKDLASAQAYARQNSLGVWNK